MTGAPPSHRPALPRFLVPALVALVLLGTTQPSAAQQRRLTDPRGDVWSVTLGEDRARPAAGSDEDLVGGLVVHGVRDVRLRWLHADLRPRGTLVVHRALVRTDGGTTYEIRVETGPGRRAGTASVFRDDRAVTCRTRHTVDHRRDRVDVSVPRACLGGPDRVRGRLDVYRADTGSTFRRDNAHDRSARTSRWTPALEPGRAR